MKPKQLIESYMAWERRWSKSQLAYVCILAAMLLSALVWCAYTAGQIADARDLWRDSYYNVYYYPSQTNQTTK